MSKSPKFYVVWTGRKPGIFDNWNDCSAQVSGFAGARYKSFSTRAEAETAFQGAAPVYVYTPGTPKASTMGQYRTLPLHRQPDSNGIAVDAACSGNPGIVEYRGVEIATGIELFRKRPIPAGTNNLGEFLAIVHALALLQTKGDPRPVYSDSANAIKWVREKKVNSKLPRTPETAEIWALTDRALDWLATHPYSTRILKWDTELWGETPADFGRK